MDYKITVGWFTPDGDGPFQSIHFDEEGTFSYISENCDSKTLKDWVEEELPQLAIEMETEGEDIYGCTLMWYENE